MTWIIVSSASAIYAFFIICLLIIGNWADDWEKALFTDRFCYNNDYAAASSMPAMPERLFGALVRS